jgi:acyl-CoA hydrolase/RimJ/RimL family protein N-acetyltransferase
MSAKAAIDRIHSGSRIFLGSGCAKPQHLLLELLKQGILTDRLHDVEIVDILSLGVMPHAESRFARHFRHNSFFVGKGIRDAVNEGFADYTPTFLSEIPSLLRSGRMPLDVVFLHVSPPDNEGLCSLGISVEVQKAAIETAELVIAQVNELMPRTCGDSLIHISRFDCIVEYEEELFEKPPASPDDVSRAIARHIFHLVDDGSTIQIGIGKIPSAVLQNLSQKRDLGIHTCMFSDGIIDLIESGAVNNSKKTFHPGKILASFCIGTRTLYNYIDNNPMFDFYPTDYTASPVNIAKNEKMVAINTALEIDISGQVSCSSLGYRTYGGIGGLADFARGTAIAPQGKSIITLASTAQNGTVSRIVSHLSEGADVSLTRGDVHFVATEYGMAHLHGKSLRERALALINIAHPKFRDKLLDQAKQLKYIQEDQVFCTDARYPVDIEHPVTFGPHEVFFRPVKPSDERMLQEFLYHLSERSVYHRFFNNMKAFPRHLAQSMVSVDFHNEMGVVGVIGTPGSERIIANGQWLLNPEQNSAEVAFAVADEYQRQGIGTHLLGLLIRLAKEQGIEAFNSDVFMGNHAMMHVFRNSGCVLHSELDSGLYSIYFRLNDNAAEVDDVSIDR